MSKRNNEFKTPMHPRDKKILIGGGIAAVLTIAIGVGLSIYVKTLPEPLPVQQPSSAPASSDTSISGSASFDASLYEIKKPNAPESSASGTEDKLIQTTDSEGNTSIEQEMGKPEAPGAPPSLPEGTDITNPEAPPEYEQESTTNTNPKPGEKNANGDTYIPGIGWVGENDKGSGGTGEVADVGSELSGIQVGH